MDVLRPPKVKISTLENTAIQNKSYDTNAKVPYLSENSAVPPNCWRQILLLHDSLNVLNVLFPTLNVPLELRDAPTLPNDELADVIVTNYSTKQI